MELPPTPDNLKNNSIFVEYDSFLKELTKESPRGVVLISCSMIDELLGRLIRSYLVEGTDSERLFSGLNAPLGTFSSRIQAAYSLGLINKREHDDCVIFKKIRNHFAHGIHVSFNDQTVKDLAASLSFYKGKEFDPSFNDSRLCFSVSANLMIATVAVRPGMVTKCRLKPLAWGEIIEL